MSVGALSIIPTVAEHVLNSVENRLKDVHNKQRKSQRLFFWSSFLLELNCSLIVTDEELLSLHSVFGNVLQRALDILEKHPTFVAYTTANKLRVLIEINGENDRCYRIFPKINYCPCLAFKHHVLEKKTQICCKHILAGNFFIWSFISFLANALYTDFIIINPLYCWVQVSINRRLQAIVHHIDPIRVGVFTCFSRVHLLQ